VSDQTDGGAPAGVEKVTPASEMVQRVAKAIAFMHGGRMTYSNPRTGIMGTVASDAGFGHWAHSVEKYAEARWHEYISVAEAAIQALREPTDAMLRVVADESWLWLSDGEVGPREIKQAWQAMIDQALK
jgi:hypothetical protein